MIMIMLIMLVMINHCDNWSDNDDGDKVSSNNGVSLRAPTSGCHQVPSITWTMFAQVIPSPDFFHDWKR